MLVVIIIAISGCTNINTPQNKTFTNSGISLQYPGNWSDNATITWTSGDNVGNTSIGSLGNGNVTLGILYLNQTKSTGLSSLDISTLGILAVNSMKAETNGNNSNILSSTTRTQNNLTFDEIIYTSSDPSSNIMYKDYYVITGQKGISIYILRFQAPESDFDKYYPQFQTIANSIHLQ